MVTNDDDDPTLEEWEALLKIVTQAANKGYGAIDGDEAGLLELAVIEYITNHFQED